jgi:hypothetical protein
VTDWADLGFGAGGFAPVMLANPLPSRMDTRRPRLRHVNVPADLAERDRRTTGVYVRVAGEHRRGSPIGDFRRISVVRNWLDL